MPRELRTIKVKNFKSLEEVDVDFVEFSVLIGPNGSGKSNLLKVLSFARDAARFDLRQALDQMGGMERVLRQSGNAARVELTIEGTITAHSSNNAKDSYTLTLQGSDSVVRTETLKYKRVSGQGRRRQLTVNGRDVRVSEGQGGSKDALRLASAEVSGLGALARVDDENVGPGPGQFFKYLSDVRYLDPSVSEARTPSRIANSTLDDSASNLAAALFTLASNDPDAFQELNRDMSRCLPGLKGIEFDQIGGSARSVVAQLRESGLTRAVDLADASFGTVRLLALLTALHESNPPRLTVIEEVDHGLHPYALDVLVDRMREASARTQIIVASHSPSLVNRLEAHEIIVCDRDPETGASVIPATTNDEIKQAMAGGDWRAGELWFAGTLAGVPS